MEFPKEPGPTPASTPEGLSPDASLAELRFARLLLAVALAILALAGLLIALPSLLEGPPLIFVIAYGTAVLFGPVGFSLLAAGWRLRSHALHGAAAEPSHRKRLRILGVILVLVGLILAAGGFGASGPVSRALDLIWGLSLAAYGTRCLIRSFVTADA